MMPTPKGAAKARPQAKKTTDTARVKWLLATLADTYPDADCALDFANPYQLLVATILSAQCTDKRVNLVTPALFEAFPNPAALAVADLDMVIELVRYPLLPFQAPLSPTDWRFLWWSPTFIKCLSDNWKGYSQGSL